ncbi:MAG: HD domain-containing protein [Kiritimatiellae bacterium]|nr:HD domain-containing protein [Kiritimatiellia bacterium]
METKRPGAIRHLADTDASALVRTMYEFQHLKTLYRQGWLRAGVPRDQCESVAEHSMGVAMLSLFLADAHFPRLDRTKILLLALLHDFGEIHAGDIVPGKMSLEEKHELEKAAVERVLAKLPNGKEYLAVWEEYEACETPEARLVKQVDRLEMGVQASIYEHEKFADLSDFFDSTDKALSTPELRAVYDELVRLRGSSAPAAPRT